MPELPEVETVVRGLRERIAGRRLSHLKLWQPGIIEGNRAAFTRHASPATVTAVRRRGKWILIDLENGHTILAHLRMTGRFSIVANGTSRQKHDHLEWRLDSSPERLRFNDTRRFGRFRIVATSEVEDHLAGLGWGPEPFEISTDSFAGRLGKSQRSIKAALLDQSVVAGIGNIYADEILFAAGIDPRTPTRQIGPARAQRIHAAMQGILQRAISARGTTMRNYVAVDGRSGGFRSLLQVFDRTGAPCPKCERPIRRIRLVGRSTHFCSRCQRR